MGAEVEEEAERGKNPQSPLTPVDRVNVEESLKLLRELLALSGFLWGDELVRFVCGEIVPQSLWGLEL